MDKQRTKLKLNSNKINSLNIIEQIKMKTSSLSKYALQDKNKFLDLCQVLIENKFWEIERSSLQDYLEIDTKEKIVAGEITIKGKNATHCTLSSKTGPISIQPNGPYTNYEGINYAYTVASASQTADYMTSRVTNSAGYVRYYAQFTAVCYNQNIASTPVSYSVEVARAALTPKEPTCPTGQRYDSNEYAKYGTNTCKPGKAFTCADGTVITVHDYAWSNESTYYFQCPVPPVLDKGVLIQTAPTFASSTDKTERVGKTNITIPRQAEGKALVLQTTGKAKFETRSM